MFHNSVTTIQLEEIIIKKTKIVEINVDNLKCASLWWISLFTRCDYPLGRKKNVSVKEPMCIHLFWCTVWEDWGANREVGWSKGPSYSTACTNILIHLDLTFPAITRSLTLHLLVFFDSSLALQFHFSTPSLLSLFLFTWHKHTKHRNIHGTKTAYIIALLRKQCSLIVFFLFLFLYLPLPVGCLRGHEVSVWLGGGISTGYWQARLKRSPSFLCITTAPA